MRPRVIVIMEEISPNRIEMFPCRRDAITQNNFELIQETSSVLLVYSTYRVAILLDIGDSTDLGCLCSLKLICPPFPS